MKDDNDDIARYRDGSMSSAERNALEKKALSDPFLADALEGVESITPEEFSSDVRNLREKLGSGKSQIRFTPMRIAAGVILLLGVGALFYYLRDDEQVMLSQEKSSQTTPATDTTLLADKNTSKKDTTSANLITLAKPRESAKQPAATAGPIDSKKPEQSASGLTSRWDTISTAGAAAGGKKVEAEPIAELAGDEKKEEVIVTDQEIKRDKKALGYATTPNKEVKEDVATVTESQQAEKAEEGRMEKKDARASGLRSTDAYKSKAEEPTISGTVTSADDGSAIPGVNVILKGTRTGTVTDAKGNYTLPVSTSDPTLQFSFIGMQSKDVTPGQGSRLDVQLEEDISQLSQIVVTGQSPDVDNIRDDLASKPVMKLAAPVGGMRAYNRYLKDNIRYPQQARENKIKGKVTVKFTVKTNGNLSEIDVVKGLGYGCDEEVIRLVKEGPKWRPSYEDDVAIESEVRVKMKFDPDKAGKQ